MKVDLKQNHSLLLLLMLLMLLMMLLLCQSSRCKLVEAIQGKYHEMEGMIVVMRFGGGQNDHKLNDQRKWIRVRDATSQPKRVRRVDLCCLTNWNRKIRP